MTTLTGRISSVFSAGFEHPANKTKARTGKKATGFPLNESALTSLAVSLKTFFCDVGTGVFLYYAGYKSQGYSLKRSMNCHLLRFYTWSALRIVAHRGDEWDANQPIQYSY
ncbi:hypothetical protein LPB67_06875 [Undibacterium sp. Jales W-56]|uniref:hypothetical protein n=1 Tax=Undibacterium sp. Jales W-56 TaxID=2897325 RepID=UPI0021D1AFD7|nr:hypothetical protein [Undibacterium sp. Jales W-56]MCU6433503.1 hypothetical protein [Undibacterium sp. Jales W-56]